MPKPLNDKRGRGLCHGMQLIRISMYFYHQHINYSMYFLHQHTTPGRCHTTPRQNRYEKSYVGISTKISTMVDALIDRSQPSASTEPRYPRRSTHKGNATQQQQTRRTTSKKNEENTMTGTQQTPIGTPPKARRERTRSEKAKKGKGNGGIAFEPGTKPGAQEVVAVNPPKETTKAKTHATYVSLSVKLPASKKAI